MSLVLDLPRELVCILLARFVPCETVFLVRACRAAWARHADDANLWSEVVKVALRDDERGWDFFMNKMPALVKRFPALKFFVPERVLWIEAQKSFALSPDGALLAGASFEEIHVVNRNDLCERVVDIAVPNVGDDSRITRVAFSPSGGNLACIGTDSDNIWVFCCQSWNHVATLSGGNVRDWGELCFLDGATLISAACSGVVWAREALTGASRFALRDGGEIQTFEAYHPLAVSRNVFAVGEFGHHVALRKQCR